ncbi:MAG: DUF4040 domain-containing protein [Alphaproteobacteria bacterium]|nr:DUF4040 domain-containing protein [Alphaproteobacteria bacterium]MBU0799210.1 DUF4040 domain-containing protein [Alphaproteobacteria bacterium]MBU0887539.1 DUF4040 domain-containing protein [Alphaproteobacteria bacterium]MBU1814776.1 DUF4040 domain-containing protein [Alphaproteobacteria bacterium]
MSFFLILPLLAGIVGSVVGARMSPRTAPLLGAGVAGIAFLSYAALASSVIAGLPVEAAFWSVPSLGMGGGLQMDGLGLVFALLISGIGFFIFLYASRYLAGDTRLTRLSVMLILFMLAMLGAVTADDVIVLFIFWEMTSLTSFFLVGYDHEKPEARKAALQALLVTGGGGLVLLAGLLLLAIAAGTTSLSGIIAARETVLADPTALAAMLLVIIGCFTKSAQVPFHFWLPNAMAAPTPVSAYLHSATMVKLGIYLLARVNPLYQDEIVWQTILTWFGLATGITGGLLALRETDLKRILAYTTLTALGTLTMLIGLAPQLSIVAAMAFLVAHALYKAALFLIAGIVDHETGTRDARLLGGLRTLMPLTAGATVLATLSMAGLPPFIGFLGKELIYEAVLGAGDFAIVLVIGMIFVNGANVAIAGLLSLRLFFGERKPTPAKPHDPPAGMLAGPITLALLGLVFGVLPALVGLWIVSPSASAILGETAVVSLSLWHGFNLVLGLSAVTLISGAVLYLSWPRLMPALQGLAFIDRFGANRAYDLGLAGILRLCDRSTALIQHGDLRGYLRTLFLVTAISLLLTLVLRDGLALPVFDWASVDARALAFLGIAGGGLATMLAPSLFGAVVASGLVGFAAALAFLFFGAPDVAFTQFAVETLLVAILAFALIRLPIRRPDDRVARDRLKDGGIAVVTGVSVTLLLLAVLATPFDSRLSDWFGKNSLPEAFGRNVVNVILVDFRALDTLGEITVLAIAAFAVLALLRPRIEKSATKEPSR